MDVRQMTEDDLPEVERLERTCFSRPWTALMIRDSLDTGHYTFWVALCAGKIAGYIGLYQVLDEGEVTNVAVFPAFRQQGAGRLLMETLVAEARKRQLFQVTLEVRVSNEPARKLYESLGFSEIGLRKRYYEAPVEDAVLYGLPLHE